MKYKDDSYQVEYAAIQDVEVTREGNWNGRVYNKEFFDDMAASYDPEMLRGKLIQDHQYGGPAYGHILALNVEDDPSAEGAFRLIATIGFLPEGLAMVESGQWNERSIGWATFHPTPGFPYLWEVSLLGANTPAAVGMAPIIFEEESSEDMMRQLAVDQANEELTAEAITKQLAWEKTDKFIRHRLRQSSRFTVTTLRTVELDADAGISAIVGKLKPKYVSEGGNADSLVLQDIMFSLDKKWTLKKAKAYVKKNELTAMDVTITGTTPFQDLPMADAETEWDLEASETRCQEFASGDDGTDWNLFRGFHLWCSPDEKEEYESYKLPIVDVVDDEFKIVPEAVIAAAESLDDIPETDVEAVKQSLEKYYDKMELKAPWQEETSNNVNNGGKTPKVKSTEGGTKMPETGVTETDATKIGTTLVVEAGSTADLAAKNAEMRIEKEKQEQETQKKLSLENAELSERLESSRLEAIKSDVRTMHAEGFILGAQVDMGLVDALAAIPDIEIVVGDKTCKAIDIIKNVLKYGGKVKLKLEIAKDILDNDEDDPLAKARAHGIDTSVLERRIQLMKDDPKMSHADALDKATRQVKK